VLVGQSVATRWTAPEGRWTEPDLHTFPQDGHRYEIVDGALHVTPPVGAAHRAAVEALIGTLRRAAPYGWWVCDRLGIETRDSNLIPDVAVLRPQSSGAIWSDPHDVALVIEVEEAASRRYDRLLKPALYAEAGIPAYWRVELSPSPAIHVYALAPAGYALEHTVRGPTSTRLSAPYPLHLAAEALA
jgi:Uma2 family endonuclease